MVLLRNEAKSGIGFQLDWACFYPDFIMWIKGADKTWMVFIDPKGLQYTKGLEDERVEFINEGIKEIERKLNQDIFLHAFILSETKYKDIIKRIKKEKILSQQDYENKKILFLEEDGWCKKLFERLIDESS